MIVIMCLIQAVIAIQLKITIPESTYMSPQLSEINNIYMTINSKENPIYPHNKNVLIIPQQPQGKHFIQINSKLYRFPILILDQKAEQSTLHLLHPVNRRIIKKLVPPFIITPLDKIQYLQPEQPFSFVSLIFSGTGIMIISAVVMLYCFQNVMPKLEEAQQAPQ